MHFTQQMFTERLRLCKRVQQMFIVICDVPTSTPASSLNIPRTSPPQGLGTHLPKAAGLNLTVNEASLHLPPLWINNGSLLHSN